MIHIGLSRRLLVAAGDSLSSEVIDACQAAALEAGFHFVLSPENVDLADIVKDDGWAFVLREIRSLDDLRAEVFFTKTYKDLMNEGRLLPVAVNWVDNLQVKGILKKMGFREVISASRVRSGFFKNRLVAIIQQPLQAPVIEMTEKDQWGPLVVRGECFGFSEPLTLEENCWLLRRTEDVKIVRDQFVIDLVGPGPSVGRWLMRSDASFNPVDGHSVWEWKPKEASPDFFGEDGAWVFWGRRPRFNEFHWTFISRRPRLAFFRKDQAAGDYLAVNDQGKLAISKNSEIAIRKWPSIHASVMNEYRVQVKAPRIDSPMIRFQKDEQEGPEWRDFMGIKTSAEEKPRVSRLEELANIQKGLAPKAELFNPIVESKKRESYLKELKDSAAPVLIWTQEQRVRFSARVQRVDLSKGVLTVLVPGEVNPEDLFTKLYVNVSFKRSGLFFSVEPANLGFDGDLIHIRIPQAVYEVQRRTFFRLAIDEAKHFFVRADDRFFRVLNVSGGGMAFLADAPDEEHFKKGMTIDRLSFEISGVRIRCKAEVRWTKAQDNRAEGENLTVGIQFLGLKVTDQQRVNMFVLEGGFEYLKESLL